MSIEYWTACLSESTATLGMTVLQIERLAMDCEKIAEMQSEAEGRHLIPNPLNTEMAELKRKHERELAAAERRFGVMRGVLASRLGCDPHLLHVDGNAVVQNRR